MTRKYKPFRTQMHMTFGETRQAIKSLADEYFAFIDLFAGAGGVTTGAEEAELDGKKVADVICAINHDRKAIESHWQNHPHVKHFVENIKKFDVNDLPKVSDPRARKFLWASLECTNFSNAKGGLPRDADSRTLGNHLPRYVKAFDPDYIGIENVREFRDWGPLIHMKDENGKPSYLPNGKPMMMPDKTKLGRDYRRWVKKMCSLGYHHEERILNSADFGAHTSRRRLFIIFAKHGLPIEWPVPTHSKDGSGGKERWKPVKECLDFSNKGENIFGRRKDLSDNTYKRIYAGLVKFIAKGDESFLAQYNGAGFDDRTVSQDAPCNTLTTENRFAVVQPEFLIKYHGNGKNVVDPNGPASSITTKDRLGLVQSDFLLNYQHSSDANSTDKPSPTIVTKDKYGLVQTEAFQISAEQTNSNGSGVKSVDDPATTITTRAGLGIVTTEQFLAIHNTAKKGHNPGRSIEQPGPALTTKPTARLVAIDRFIDMQHSQGKRNESIDSPTGAITTVPKKNLVTVERFIDQQHGQSKPQSIEIPSNTILANPKQNLVAAFLMNRQYNNVGSSIENPCFTLIAQMNKRPAYLVQLETGDIAITVESTDTEIMRKIKLFMAAHGVIAIYMRMLTVPELLRITGLPEDYILEGTQGDAKKFIGNAVPPVLPKVMIEALAKSLQKQKKAKAA
jgi:DNA (cytosine-5)-methyltransferase 1